MQKEPSLITAFGTYWNNMFCSRLLLLYVLQI